MPNTFQQPAPTPGHYLRRADAAAYVREKFGFPCSRQWLAKLAVIGGGPVFRKAGRFPIYCNSEGDFERDDQAGRTTHR